MKLSARRSKRSPHLRREIERTQATQPCNVLNLNVPEGLHIGYIAGDIDPLPETLRQTGIQVDMLDEVALAFGDLSHFDAIDVGIRAYVLRPDVVRINPRLLDYVQKGRGRCSFNIQREC